MLYKAIAGLTLMGLASFANAAEPNKIFSTLPAFPTLDPSKTRPVLLVHGWSMYDIAKVDCASRFRPIVRELKQQGFTGPFLTVTYYQASTNCDINLTKYDASITKNSSWKEIGRALSNYVYNNYSRHGQSVDMLGHSMGGLVIRSAIQGGSEYQKGFSNILVEDAVTVGTPHQGSGMTGVCIHAQCKSLGYANPDFRWLAKNPKPNGMTEIDWSVQGSTLDAVVTTQSSMAMGLNYTHKKLFHGLTHNNLLSNATSVRYMVKSLGTNQQ